MYSLLFEKNVIKFLSKLDKKVSLRIIKKLNLLQNNPYPADAKRIVNVKDKVFRIRIGDYRALYRIEGNEIIIVFLVDKRDRVYD